MDLLTLYFLPTYLYYILLILCVCLQFPTNLIHIFLKKFLPGTRNILRATTCHLCFLDKLHRKMHHCIPAFTLALIATSEFWTILHRFAQNWDNTCDNVCINVPQISGAPFSHICKNGHTTTSTTMTSTSTYATRTTHKVTSTIPYSTTTAEVIFIVFIIQFYSFYKFNFIVFIHLIS